MKKNRGILVVLLLAMMMGLGACGATAAAPAEAPAPTEEAAKPAAETSVTEATTAEPAAETPMAAPAEAEAATAEEPEKAEDRAVVLIVDEEGAYDAAAFDAAAQAVRDEFIRVIQEGIDKFDEAAHPELPWYTAALTRFQENSYYEAFHDFDGNGVPEMLIAVGDDTYRTPIAVYAFDGQQMHYLCKEHPLGERAALSRADGLFVVHGSGGAASGVLAVYRIAGDGYSTETVDVIDYEYSDADHVTYTSEMGNISPDEVVSRGIAEFMGLDVEPNWTRFYP